MNAKEAAEQVKALAHVMGGDPYGVRTLAGAEAAYKRGDIEVEELERRVALILGGVTGAATDDELDALAKEVERRLDGIYHLSVIHDVLRTARDIVPIGSISGAAPDGTVDYDRRMP